jgi:hypothetical protein
MDRSGREALRRSCNIPIACGVWKPTPTLEQNLLSGEVSCASENPERKLVTRIDGSFRPSIHGARLPIGPERRSAGICKYIS